jgi:hypothetical protein
MLFNLHSDYVKAVAAPRPRHSGGAGVRPGRSEPPPGRLRVHVARVLVSAAERLDRESVHAA